MGSLSFLAGLMMGTYWEHNNERCLRARLNALKQPPLTEAEKWQAENALIAAHRVSPKYEAVKLEAGMIYPPPPGSQPPAPCTCPEGWPKPLNRGRGQEIPNFWHHRPCPMDNLTYMEEG